MKVVRYEQVLSGGIVNSTCGTGVQSVLIRVETVYKAYDGESGAVW